MENANSSLLITDLESLELEIHRLEQKIAKSDARVVTAAKELISFDVEWLNGNVTKLPLERQLDMAANPAKKLIPNLFATLMGQTVFKKTSFFKKLIFKQVSKVILRKGLKAALNKPMASEVLQTRPLNTTTVVEQSEKDIWVGDMEVIEEEKSPVGRAKKEVKLFWDGECFENRI